MYDVIWNGSRHHPGGRQLICDEYPTVIPGGDVFQGYRRVTSLTPAEREQIIADVQATSYRQTAKKHRLTLAAVQGIVGGSLKRRRGEA